MEGLVIQKIGESVVFETNDYSEALKTPKFSCHYRDIGIVQFSKDGSYINLTIKGFRDFSFDLDGNYSMIKVFSINNSQCTDMENLFSGLNSLRDTL